jgi:hypothetical protein
VVLDPGSPGYIVATGLSVPTSGTTLQSSSATNATLLAAAGLAAPLLTVSAGVNHLTVVGITFDGNRPSRTMLSSCTQGADRTFGNDVYLQTANALVFENNVVTRTLCGSGLKVAGTNMLIQNNTFRDNGHGTEALDAGAPWADGMTLLYCQGSQITANHFIDNTDLSIANFQGPACTVSNNLVEQVSRHAFSGISFGVTNAGATSDHTGSVMSGNTIIGRGRLSFGINDGSHPWFNTSTSLGGTITGNTVSGAIVNLLVDGAKNSTIGQNTLSAPSGSPKCPANLAGPYNFDLYAPHAVGVTTTMVPDGVRSYDTCIP